MKVPLTPLDESAKMAAAVQHNRQLQKEQFITPHDQGEGPAINVFNVIKAEPNDDDILGTAITFKLSDGSVEYWCYSGDSARKRRDHELSLILGRGVA